MPTAGIQGDYNDMNCVIEGCEGFHDARGWCNKHYQRWWKYGDPATVQPKLGRKAKYFGCKVADCGGEHSAKGYCRRHYRAFHRYGNPLIVLPQTGSKSGGARLHARATLPQDIKEAYGF